MPNTPQTRVKLVARRLTSGPWIVDAESGIGEKFTTKASSLNEAFAAVVSFLGADTGEKDWPSDRDLGGEETKIERA